MQKTQFRFNAGFTLLELMVAVGLVGVLAAVAFPYFHKFVLEAKRADGVAILMRAYKDQLDYQNRNFATTGKGEFTEYIKGPNGDGIGTRPASKPRYNLITGSWSLASSCSNGVVCEFSQLDSGWGFTPAVNKFGFPQNYVTGFDKHRFLIGAEADITGDGKLDVMAVNEKGTLFQLCDSITSQAAPDIYQTYKPGGAPPLKCNLSAAGEEQQEGGIAGDCTGENCD